MNFMIDNCMPLPGGSSSNNQLADLVKTLFGGITDAGDVVKTGDGKITITDKETLKIARTLLDRVEKELDTPEPQGPLEPMVKMAGSLMNSETIEQARRILEMERNNNNGRPSDFKLDEVKKPRYTSRGPYKPKTKTK